MNAILVRISRHLRTTGMAETRFGRCAIGDPRLIGDLRRGREPRPQTIERIEAFMVRQEQGR